jgi:hypothetical protein
MFEVVAYALVTIAVLAFCGNSAPRAEMPVVAEVLEVPEVAEVAAIAEPDEQPTHQAAPGYTALSIEELKAEGKRLKVKGWQRWTQLETAIARLEAITV